MTILPLARSRADVLRDVRNKLARTQRDAARAVDAGNVPAALALLADAERLSAWVEELER